MNAKQLCSTTAIRPDATGGVVPAPAPPQPMTGNLLQNTSLETLRATGAEPRCFQQSGATPAGNTATWTVTNDAHTGTIAARVRVSTWNAGDRKLVLTQRPSEHACLTAAVPGRTYTMSAWYKGSWKFAGATPTKVSFATYYRNAAGAWVYWQSSPLLAPSSSWNLASFTSGPLPAGATAISFGLAIKGRGSLTTDDYALAVD